MPIINIGDVSLGLYRSADLANIRRNVEAAFASVGPGNLDTLQEALIAYLSLVPMEDVFTEHLLTTLRRWVCHQIGSCLGPQGDNPQGGGKSLKRRFADRLLEPSLWQQARDKNPRGDKELETICYEVARLLDTMGYQHRAIALFDHVMDSKSATQRDHYLYLLAMDGKAVALQNSGDFGSAYALSVRLEGEINVLKNSITGNQYSSIAHFQNKHRATLLRRRYFIDLNNQSRREPLIKEIESAFASAKNEFETYMVCFSMGHFKYFISDAVDGPKRTTYLQEAEEYFGRCIELLGKDAQEYYLVHFYRVMIELEKTTDYDSLYNQKILPLIKSFRKAVERNADYKTDLNSFLIDLIPEIMRNGWNDGLEQKIKKQLPGMLTTHELLDSTRKSINRIVQFFERRFQSDALWRRMNETIADIIAESEATFVKKAQILGRTDAVHPKEGISLCVDLRGWTNANLNAHTPEEKDRLKELMSSLKEMIQIHLADHMDDINYAGDGFIMAKYTANRSQATNVDPTVFQSAYAPILTKLVQGARRLLREMEGKELSLGIGIAYGALDRLECSSSSFLPREYHFSGSAANLAARMADIARPSGLVIFLGKVKKENPNTFAVPLDLSEALQDYDLNELTVPGKHPDEFFRVYTSGDINVLTVKHKYPYKYFSKPPFDQERRIFVNFGPSCNRGCRYCISNNVSYDKVNGEEFIEEYKQLRSDAQVDNAIFSFGSSNDPLSEKNFKSTASVMARLLEHFWHYRTGNILQIATKESLNRIRELLDSIKKILEGLVEDQGNVRRYPDAMIQSWIHDRIIIFYSLSTIDRASSLEGKGGKETGRTPGRLRQDLKTIGEKQDNKGFLGMPFGVPVIPYVKPFLPGITDKDDALKDLLAKCKLVVVGTAYISRPISHKMALWALENKLPDLAEGPYNFVKQHENLNGQNRGQRHPCPNLTGEMAHVFNWMPPLLEWVKSWSSPPGQEPVTVFLSSPCAVSHIVNQSCHTHVGNNSRGFAADLCIGKKGHALGGCPNKVCLYNESLPPPANLGERIMRKLEAFRPADPDPSHGIDHFIRVRKLADKIVSKRGLTLSRDGWDVLHGACLLHDLGDSKITFSQKDQREEMVGEFLQMEINADVVKREIVDRIKLVVKCTSFEDYVKAPDRAKRREPLRTVNDPDISNTLQTICDVLEDADRIDAIGAIGIARCFAFRRNRGIFNLREIPRTLTELGDPYGKGFDRYRSSITHFYEKLLNLRDGLNLSESKEIAGDRHEFMVTFLKKFLDEVEYERSSEAEVDLKSIGAIMKRWKGGVK